MVKSPYVWSMANSVCHAPPFFNDIVRTFSTESSDSSETNYYFQDISFHVFRGV